MKRRYNVLLAACCVLALACLQPAYGGVDSLGVWSQDLPNSTRIYTMDISSTNGNLIYCAGLDSGVYKSTNAGANWLPVNTGLTYNHVQAIAMSQSNNNVVYCGTDQLGSTNSGVYKTTDGGASWAPANNGILESSRGIQAIVVHPTNPNVAWMSVFDGLVNSTAGLYKTTDGGANWVPSNNGIGTIKNFLSIAVNPLNPNTVYCGTSFSVVAPTLASRIYKSYDGGANWINISNGLPTDTTIGHPVRALSVSTADTNIVLAALFLASDTLGGAYVTTNGGTTWVRKHTGLQSINGALPRACLIKPGSTTDFFVGLDGGTANARGVWATTNGGTSWFDFNNGSMVNTYTIRALVFKAQGNPTLYAGAANATVAVAGRGVYEYSWTAPQPPVINRALLLPTPGVNTNYVQIPHQPSMVGFGNNITIEAWVRIGGSTTANTVLNHGAVSFDYQLGINANTIFPFFRAGTTIVIDSFANVAVQTWAHLAVTYDGTTIKFYKDGVLHFSRVVALTLGSSTNEMRIGRGNADAGSGNLDEVRLWSVARTQGQIDSTKCLKYPGQFSSTVGLKAVWHFDSTYVDSVSNYNGTPLGTAGFQTVDLPCGPVGVAEEKPDVPADYQVEQNYPNPFNPVTRIRYSLPQSAHVILKVYNILGQEIATLVNGQQAAGPYQVVWEGRNNFGAQVSSGVYFYRFETMGVSGERFNALKKMLFLK